MPDLRFRLLMVEDSPHRVERIRSWLPAYCLLVEAASAGKAIGILQRDRGYVYGAVMLDHDLHERAFTEEDLSLSATDLLDTLTTCLSRDVAILVHSMNTTRSPGLVRRLESAGFEVTRVPFTQLERAVFRTWLDDARYNWEDAHGIAHDEPGA
jgi:CheY-like chemotaxis protein